MSSKPYFETADGTRLYLVCEVIDELQNQIQDRDTSRLEEGLEVIRSMALRMESKLTSYKSNVKVN